MARLSEEILGRCEAFSQRMLDVVEVLEKQGRSRRICEQMTGCGTSVGANVFEADEAMTRKDFVRCLAIAVKELSESRFWLRLVAGRGWVSVERLEPLIDATRELRKIMGTMISRTLASARRAESPI